MPSCEPHTFFSDCFASPLPTLLLVVALGFPLWTQTGSPEPQQSPRAEKIFAQQCAVCNGADARGGEYAPRLAGNGDLRGKPLSWLRDVIKNGIPSGGMPAFDLPPADLDGVTSLVRSLN